MRILIIDDEKEIANFVLAGLRAENFAADWAPDADKGLMFAKIYPYDCVIIDIRLPGAMDGLTICKTIRGKGKNFPIIMLSATRDTETKIAALNSGADDYLTKPFLFAELLARIRALLRRERILINTKMVVADIVMDTQTHEVLRDGKQIHLNRKEFALLEYFMRNPGTLLTRSMILDHVWDVTIDQFTNTVDVHVRFLRRKIDDGRKKKLIQTIHGCGYKLEA